MNNLFTIGTKLPVAYNAMKSLIMSTFFMKGPEPDSEISNVKKAVVSLGLSLMSTTYKVSSSAEGEEEEEDQVMLPQLQAEGNQEE